MPVRVVMLTNGNLFGVKVLTNLKKYDIKIDSVVCESRFNINDCVPRNNPSLQFGNFVKTSWNWLLFFRRYLRAKRAYSGLSKSFFTTGPLNSDEMEEDLKRIKPDYLILGGIGILNDKILNIPKYGTINAHPGLLPWMRGNGVVGNAVLHNIPVGATCHFVNANIDRGPIISKRLLKITNTIQTLSELEKANEELAAIMLSDIIKDIMSGKQIKSICQEIKYPLYKILTTNERNTIESLIYQGKHQELFDKYEMLCSDLNAINLMINGENF